MRAIAATARARVLVDLVIIVPKFSKYDTAAEASAAGL